MCRCWWLIKERLQPDESQKNRQFIHWNFQVTSNWPDKSHVSSFLYFWSHSRAIFTSLKSAVRSLAHLQNYVPLSSNAIPMVARYFCKYSTLIWIKAKLFGYLENILMYIIYDELAAYLEETLLSFQKVCRIHFFSWMSEHDFTSILRLWLAARTIASFVFVGDCLKQFKTVNTNNHKLEWLRHSFSTFLFWIGLLKYQL